MGSIFATTGKSTRFNSEKKNAENKPQTIKACYNLIESQPRAPVLPEVATTPPYPAALSAYLSRNVESFDMGEHFFFLSGLLPLDF